jgi:histidinol dehydrogenase
MKIFKYPDSEELSLLLKRPALNQTDLTKSVMDIISDVKERGDEAIFELTKKFDGFNLDNIMVSSDEISECEQYITDELKVSIKLAIDNITKFHKAQDTVLPVIKTTEGVKCWQKAVPIEKVGLYIPGGSAPLFSTVLMLAIPAVIAGCKEIVLCTPCGKNGKVHPAVLYAAKEAGVKKIFKVGGAQAIAAMAYGTASIPKVYKVFGPGNQYVTAAKQILAQREVAIDMPAGPSEVEILADESANPAYVASDLLSQAEHGADSQSILITTSESLAKAVEIETLKQAELLTRNEIINKSLEHCRLIVVKNIEEAITATNEYAPEHLIISAKNYSEIAESIINAGSVFLGSLTPESAGDYASGTNHTLPTNGYAKAYSGVNLDSFRKKITFQEITMEGLKNIGKAIQTMAEAENLTAHSNAVKIRMNKN